MFGRRRFREWPEAPPPLCDKCLDPAVVVQEFGTFHDWGYEMVHRTLTRCQAHRVSRKVADQMLAMGVSGNGFRERGV